MKKDDVKFIGLFGFGVVFAGIGIFLKVETLTAFGVGLVVGSLVIKSN